GLGEGGVGGVEGTGWYTGLSRGSEQEATCRRRRRIMSRDVWRIACDRRRRIWVVNRRRAQRRRGRRRTARSGRGRRRLTAHSGGERSGGVA
ncbi:hypothetical protein U1Q18_009302, partial [Sarracenia purpurea var. burkii]